MTRLNQQLVTSIIKKSDVERESRQDRILYVPVALCIVTRSSYIDLFRHILEEMYSFLLELCESSQVMSSCEFLRQTFFLLNDTVIPPNSVMVNLLLSNTVISIPPDVRDRLPHNESCIAVLIDLLDIANVLDLWETIILHKPALIISGNEYLLYLILEAFKLLIFPLEWNTQYFPTLNRKQLKATLAGNSRTLAGANSCLISVKEALELNPGLVVLDIDSNMVYKDSAGVLCVAARAYMGKRIQLTKAYYYMSAERLNTFQMSSLESEIEDPVFVGAVQRLQGIWDPAEKEDLFITLIRDTFFSGILKHIVNYEEYIVHSAGVSFDRAGFLKTIECCEHQCTMKEFMGQFIDSENFSTFLSFYEKLDEGNSKKQREIVKSIAASRYELSPQLQLRQIDLAPSISPEGLFSSLSGFYATAQPSINVKCARGLLDDLIPLLSEFECYRETGLHFARKMSFSMYLVDNMQSSTQSLFYGEFGIIKLVKNIVDHIDPLYLKGLNAHKEVIEQLESDSSWENLLLLVSFLRKSKCRDYLKVAEVLRELNKQKPSELPGHYTMKILLKLQRAHPVAYNSFKREPGLIAQITNSLG